MAHDRANAFHWYDAYDCAVWLDYDGQNRVVGLAVQNDGDRSVFAQAVTVTKVAGKNTFSKVFGPGLTVVAIPTGAKLTVGFDANDGNAPFVSGLSSLLFSTV